MHHLNDWGLAQDRNGESASPCARWGEATFKGVVVVWSQTMYISGVIARCCGYWHTAIQIDTNSCLKKKNVTSKWFEVFKRRWRYPEFWSPYSCAPFWCTRERPCMNRVWSLLSMQCLVLGYSFELKPTRPALGTTGSVVTSGLSINGCSHPAKPVKR